MTQKSPEKILREAEILIKTGNLEKQACAEKWLRQIKNDYPSSFYATQARQLLADLDRHLSPPPPKRENSELANRLSHKWAGINSHKNAQLYPFLEQLFDPNLQAGTVISNLRQTVIKQFKQWILEIKNEECLNDLINPIQQHSDFKHHLDEALENWRQKKLIDKYHTTEIKVKNALQNWAVDDAKKLISDLSISDLPLDLQNHVVQFQQAIKAIDNDKQRLETLLNRIQPVNCFVHHNTSWIALQKCLEHCQQLQPFQIQSNYPIPNSCQTKIDEAFSALSPHIEAFLKNKAQTCHDFSAVRRFYNELEILNTIKINVSVISSFAINWFNLAQTNYQKHNDNELQQAKSKEDLEPIRQQILEEKKSLPAELAQWLENRADAVSTLIAQWETLKTGTGWIENRESSVAVPDKLQREIADYQKWWQKLQKIKQRIAPENVPTENDFKIALNELERLAALHPQHQLIQTLLSEVKINSQCYRFDEALEQWDIDRFLQLCQQTPSTEIVQPYLQLAKNQGYLQTLKQLAQDKFSTFQQAATWWQDWQRTIRQLPEMEKCPAPFSAQLQNIANDRKTAWFNILDALLENPKVTAAICRDAANTLEPFKVQSKVQSNDFIDYYQKLRLFACQNKIQEHINLENWQSATKALGQFKNFGGDKYKVAQFTKTIERLKISQILAQAEADSLDKLADVLKEQWFLVTRYLSDKEVESLLDKTLRHTWQNQDKERLSTLTQLADQINRSESFRLWLDWLNIEAALLKPKISEPTLSDFIKLIFQQNQQAEILRDDNNHVFIHEKLREPLKQLVKQWQNENNLLFTWFYNASQRIHPPLIHEAVEPLTQLKAQSEKIAEQVKDQLAQKTDISDTDLVNAQKTLQSEQSLWQRLIEYNQLLPFEPVHQPKVPPILDEINELVEKLLQIKQQFVALEEADLRETRYKRQLDEITNFIQNNLIGFQIHSSWLNRAYALEPLTRLTFTLSQFAKATLCFGSESKIHFGKTQHTPHPSQEGNQPAASPLLRGDLGVCYFGIPENWECEALDPLDKKHDWLGEIEKHLLELITSFINAQVKGRGMWRRVSHDCWTLICQKGGVLLPVPTEPDLQALCDLLPVLAEEEKQFRQQLENTYQKASALYIPTGWQGKISEKRFKEKFEDFFAAFPPQPPRTRRCYQLFEREIQKEPIATLLEQDKSQSYLPKWINQRMANGK